MSKANRKWIAASAVALLTPALSAVAAAGGEVLAVGFLHFQRVPIRRTGRFHKSRQQRSHRIKQSQGLADISDRGIPVSPARYPNMRTFIDS